MKELSGKRVLTFVGEIYEEMELWYPKFRLEEAGAKVVMAGQERTTYTGKYGYPAKADAVVSELSAEEFDGLFIPGGFMPDKLRRDEHVLRLTKDIFEQGKLVGMICHAGWIPISAGIVSGKRVTSTPGIKDDLTNAGASWVDQPLVVDGNLISSRQPLDLPLFGRALVDYLKES